MIRALLLLCLWATLANAGWLLTPPPSSGGSADCVGAPTLLCLAGRTGTTNDPTISTDGAGTIYGSGASATGTFLGLHLNAQNNTTLGPLALNLINTNTTVWQGANALLAFGLTNSPITLNDDSGSSTPGELFGLTFQGQFVVNDTSLGGPILNVFSLVPNISNTPTVAKNLAQLMYSFESDVNFVSDGAASTITGDHSDFYGREVYQTANGGTLAVPDVIKFRSGGSADSGVTFASHTGFGYEGVQGAGHITGDSVAFHTIDGDTTATGRMLSFQSTGALRQLSHLGAAVFGADAAPTGSYILEAIGNAHVSGTSTFGGALLLSGATPSCGTGCASVSGNDRIADVTVSSGVVTSVTVNFSTTLGSTPVCHIEANSATPVWVSSTSASAVTLTASATIGSGHISLFCLEKV